MSTSSSAQLTEVVKSQFCPSFNFTSYHSPPFPLLLGTEALTAFLIGRGEAVDGEEKYQIWPPTILLLFDSVTGKFFELRRYDPEAIRSGDPEEAMQRGVSPDEKSEAEYLDQHTRLCEACDETIEQYLANREWKKPFAEFEKAFKGLAESELHAFYGSLVMKQLPKM